MADWSLFPGNSLVTTHIASVQSGTANTKGGYGEVIASAEYTSEMLVQLNCDAANRCYLATLAVGSAGNEVDVINDITIQNQGSSQHIYQNIGISIVLQQGQRLSMKQQCTDASVWMDVGVSLLSPTFNSNGGFAVCDTVGANTADSGGTSIDPGGTISTKGSWVQFSASADRDYKGLVIGAGNGDDWTRMYGYWLVDVGLSSSPSDRIIISDYVLRQHSNGDGVTPCSSPLFNVAIPKGAEIHVRASCTLNDASDRLFDCILYLLT